MTIPRFSGRRFGAKQCTVYLQLLHQKLLNTVFWHSFQRYLDTEKLKEQTLEMFACLVVLDCVIAWLLLFTAGILSPHPSWPAFAVLLHIYFTFKFIVAFFYLFFIFTGADETIQVVSGYYCSLDANHPNNQRPRWGAAPGRCSL